jgi:phage tail tape-measure protein
MSDKPDYRLPPGHQPYDQLNGARVGAIAGGAVGAAMTAAGGIQYVWFVAVFAIVGAAVGAWSQRLRSGSGGRD